MQVLWELLTWQLPWEGVNLYQVRQARLPHNGRHACSRKKHCQTVQC